MAGTEFELNEATAALRVLPFVIVDDANGNPTATALIAGDFKLWKFGAAHFVASTNAPVQIPDIVGGWYVQLVAGELDTPGIWAWWVAHAGVRTILDFEVVKGIGHRVWGALPADHKVAGSFGEQIGRPIANVVANAGNTASTFKTDLAYAGAAALKDAYGCFLSGALLDQVRKITNYDPATGFLTFGVDPFSGAPAAADRLVIVNK